MKEGWTIKIFFKGKKGRKTGKVSRKPRANMTLLLFSRAGWNS
jgi:hypothetical protein